MPALCSQQQIDVALQSIPGWMQVGSELVKEYTLQDFKSAISFVQRVGEKAEAADHHPDILIHKYRKVRISLSTHSAGGITQNDFDMAGSIESVFG